MRNRIILALLTLALGLPAFSQIPVKEVVYRASKEDFINPERGFVSQYSHPREKLDPAMLAGLRAKNQSVIWRLYDARKPDAGRLARVAEKLTEQVHHLDDSRPVTSALSFPELSNHTGYAAALDIAGYNYREAFYEDDHRTWPKRVILGSENSHDPAAWRAVEDHDFIGGQFLWTGIDFLGECPGWPMRISRAGALDLRGQEKPQYAQRAALWTSEPMIRIAVASAGEEDRGAWGETFRWEGVPGKEKRISCYTNGKEAELFLNGKSFGKADSGPPGPQPMRTACWKPGRRMCPTGWQRPERRTASCWPRTGST